MKKIKKFPSFFKAILLTSTLLITSCSTSEVFKEETTHHQFKGHPHKIVGEPFYSSRDYVTINHQNPQWQFADYDLNQSTRDPANDCFSAISNFLFGSKVPKPEVNKDTLPLLSGLVHEVKKGPKKEYVDYWADPKILKALPEYDEFLEKTVEIIFTPHEPFGHIRLRVGKKLYGFENVQWTTNKEFSPMFHKSTNQDLPSSTGAVFFVGADKIKSVQKEIEDFYTQSSKNNFPPFDAYSSLLKIEEKDKTFGSGKSLHFISDAPKFGNNKEVNGKIVEKNGRHFLVSSDGYEFEIQKKGNQYFSNSFSCSSSAGHILEKYFQINIHGTIAAKNTVQSILNLNAWGNTQPVALMRYYEKE